MTTISIRIALLTTCALISLPRPVSAAIFRVTSSPDADCTDLACDLQSALAAAQANGAASNTIRVAQGTYTGNFSYVAPAAGDHDLVLEGGWTADFSSRSLDPSKTILDGNFAGRVLVVDNWTNHDTGEISVEAFTIRNGSSSTGGGAGARILTFPPGGIVFNRNIVEGNETPTTQGVGGLVLLTYDTTGHAAGPIVFSNNVVRNNLSGGAAGGYIPFGGTTVVVNNLVYGNTASHTTIGSGNGGGLTFTCLGGHLYFVNNTVTGNTAHTYGGGLYLAASGSGWESCHFHFHNNFIRGNNYVVGFLGDTDIFNTISTTLPASGNTLRLEDNDFHGLGNWPNPPAVTPTLVDNIDASCLVGGGNHHLAPGTPCIDRGDNGAQHVPDADLDGKARLCDGDGSGGAVVDIGAYEYGGCVLVVPETICDNCIDDDMDTLVDRDDPDCQTRADGSGAGLDDPKGRGKAAVKCTKATEKAGAAFVGKTLQALQKCVDVTFACLQRKPGDAGCLTKAQATCAKTMAKIFDGDASLEGKLETALAKACGNAKDGTPQLSIADSLAAVGQGYESETEACARVGVTLDSGAAFGECILRVHGCRAEQLLRQQVPRARELLTAAGVDLGAFHCLDPAADGGGLDLGDPKAKGKAAVKCQSGIKKAAAKFATGKAKSVQKCIDKAFSCVQTKPGDAGCLAKSGATCRTEIGKLGGLEAKLAATIAKACDTEDLELADLLDSNGLGFGAHAAECHALGVSPLDSVSAIAECIERQHECRVEQLLENEAPRMEELLSLGGVTLP